MNQRKFKGLLSIVLCAAVMLASASGVFGINTFAQSSGGTTGECTWSLDDTGTVLTISGNGKVDNLNRLGPSASQITKVIIESGVTGINNSAFAGCSGLKSITIPDSVKSIGNSAFAFCKGFSEVTIPSSIESIEYGAFQCSSLEKIIIPDGVKSIGEYAFSDCNNLTSIEISASVESIGDGAFSDCENITSIAVAEGNKKYHSAENCVIETETKLLLLGCQNSVIPSDGSVTSIGNSAFSYCESLKEIIIPDSVTSIGDAAFDHCNGLKRVTLPSGITSIGDSVFYACASLEEITIPSGVTSIGNYTFYFCESLKSITIPDGVTSIGMEAFFDCTNLKSVTIPDSVTSIGNNAFSGCSSLTSITIPDGVTSIGYSAFSGCSSLTSITIPSGVTSIGGSAFSGCGSLTSITISGGVTRIGYSAFNGCNIEKVYISDMSKWLDITLDGYGSNPLGNNCSLYLNGELIKSLIIPDGVTSIRWSAFANCTSIESVTLPDGVTSIGDGAFSGCSSLTDIFIPKSIKSVGYNAFGNSNINNVYYEGNEDDWRNVSSDYSLSSAMVYYDSTGIPEAMPSAPELLKKTACTVTLKAVEGNEYMIKGGMNSQGRWQTSNVFTGLIPNCKYTFCRRTAANGDTPAGEISYALTVTTKSIIRGDVNDDREINIIDLVRLKKYLANPDYNNHIQRQLCDVNGDGGVTADDLSALRKMLLAQ